ncbi:MAG: efflux RND transporter periplasmic adaptor subunit [Paludibacteraceae bacterium]
MRKIHLYVALLGAAVGLAGCRQTQPNEAAGSAVAKEALLTITRQDVAIEESYSAAIRGRQDIAIMPQVSGTLTELRVVEGERVKKGQVLFVVDQVPFRAQVETSEANVKVAEAGVATARLVYESKQQLYAEDVISQFDLQTAENSYLSAQAGLAQAQAALVIARNNLNYTEVKSPCDGVVGTLPFRVGALVSPGMPQPLTTVSDNAVMYVYFSMTENQWLSQVRRYGSKEAALRQMPAVALVLSDGSRYEQAGKIETVSGVIDPQTGTVSVRAAFPNPNGLLTAGGAGNVVLTRVYPEALVIPRTATFEVQDKVFVYRAVDGHAVATQVAVTRLNGGKTYVVESGLQEGDVIITEGVAMMKDGEEI